MMASPRPSYGRERNYGTQGHNECACLVGLRIGLEVTDCIINNILLLNLLAI